MSRLHCSRALALENAAFLDALRQTGNVGMAARQVRRSRRTMERRRQLVPGFRVEWTAALVVAAARLHAGVARRSPDVPADAVLGGHRTAGGEPVFRRTRGGYLQQQAAAPGRLTRRCEQGFLLALSVTANVQLSAAAAGTTTRNLYRRREADEAFAREWRMALEEGYGRLQLRCLEAADPENHAHDSWRHNERPAMPPMSFNQMLQLLYLHQKEARLLAEPAYLKRRRGESREAHSFRLTEMYRLGEQRSREQFRVAEAVRAARGEPTHFEWERIVLPDLAQVQVGRGDPAKPPHDADTAMFGGWRIKEMEAKLAEEPRRPPPARGKRREPEA